MRWLIDYNLLYRDFLLRKVPVPKEEGAVVCMGCTEGANIVVTELGKVFTWGLDIFSLGVAPSTTSGHREYFPYAKPQDNLNDLSPIVGGNRSLHHSLNSVKQPVSNPGSKSKRDLAKTCEKTPTADLPESTLRLVGDMRVPRTVSQPQLLPQHLLTAVPCDTIKNQRYFYNILKSN